MNRQLYQTIATRIVDARQKTIIPFLLLPYTPPPRLRNIILFIFINLEGGGKKFTRLYRVSFEKLLLKVVQQKLKYIFSYPPAFSFLSAIKLLISLLTRYNNLKHLYSTIYTELKIYNNFLLGHLFQYDITLRQPKNNDPLVCVRILCNNDKVFVPRHNFWRVEVDREHRGHIYRRPRSLKIPRTQE